MTLAEKIRENFIVPESDLEELINNIYYFDELKEKSEEFNEYRQLALNILESLSCYTELEGEDWYRVEDEMTDLIESYYGQKVFYIPTEWIVSANIEIKAHSLEEAIKIIDEGIEDIILPTDCEYVGGSHKRWKPTNDEKENLEYYQALN